MTRGKHKIIIILFLSILLSQGIFAQTDFSFGPELGISLISGQQGWDFSEEEPLISPLISISGLLRIRKHFQITTKVQYEYIGYSTNHIKIIYHKLCIPFTCGIAFGKSKIKPAVFIGYRPNLLLSGKKEEDWGVLGIINKDPFSYENPPEKYTNQFTTGVSTYFGNNIVINLSYSAGQLIKFGYTTTIIHHGVISETRYIEDISLRNNEFAINLTYHFNLNKAAD